MRIVINRAKSNTSKPFPKLMIYEATGVIIIATGFFPYTERDPLLKTTYIGVVVYSGSDEEATLGEKGVLFSNEFVDFDGSVTLSND